MVSDFWQRYNFSFFGSEAGKSRLYDCDVCVWLELSWLLLSLGDGKIRVSQ